MVSSAYTSTGTKYSKTRAVCLRRNGKRVISRSKDGMTGVQWLLCSIDQKSFLCLLSLLMGAQFVHRMNISPSLSNLHVSMLPQEKHQNIYTNIVMSTTEGSKGSTETKENVQDDAAVAATLQEDENAAARPAVVVGEPVVAQATPVEVYPAEPASRQPAQGESGREGSTAQIESVEDYCGPTSCAIACILVLLFWPAALFVPLCPCDRRRVIRTYAVR